MSQEMMAAIALAVGIAVAIPTYRWASKKKTKNQKRLEKNKKAGRCAIGEYHSSKVLPGDLSSNNPRMRHDSLQVKYELLALVPHEEEVVEQPVVDQVVEEQPVVEEVVEEPVVVEEVQGEPIEEVVEEQPEVIIVQPEMVEEGVE